MVSTLTERKRIRKSFHRQDEVAPMPNLIEVQKKSYDQFLYSNPETGEESGLSRVLKGVFPFSDFPGRSTLEFVDYKLEKPKYDVNECQQRDVTYAAPLRVTLRLVVFDIDEETEAKSIRDIKEQDVYLGDIPLMTDNGTFIVNGTERVIVSQMHRSPGVFFDHDRGKTHVSGKYLFAARVIPYRGSWLDFEFDIKDIMHVRIDRRRKLPLTTLLYSLLSEETIARKAAAEANGEEFDSYTAFGMSKQEILQYYYNVVTYDHVRDEEWKIPIETRISKGRKLEVDLISAETGEIVAKSGSNFTARTAKKLKENGTSHFLVQQSGVIGRFVSEDIVNRENGLVHAEAGDEITEEMLESFAELGIRTLPTLDIDYINVGPYLRNTLAVDKNSSLEDALIDIYRIMRPGEPPTLESAETLYKGLFFGNDRYDLSAVGRVKMNSRLGHSSDDVPDTIRVLRKDDILEIVRILLDLKDGRGDIDDIDHLGNRRVRSVGELIENQYRLGLLRMERPIRERMSLNEIDTMVPHDLINAKPVSAAVREFLGSSQLSQFMDQTNPLSEITHKRRLSALGPGGLTRERAGFEVRDVHPTHYGRICPIETPEGPNIGLINSLATYARVNRYGFIETPYRRVVDGVIQTEVFFMSAMDEKNYNIAQADTPAHANGKFKEDLISCRRGSDYVMSRPEDVVLIDVSPKQLVSVAASLIPFLENDDANRALMGSNMQRQAVPLLRAEAPLVGTGMESRVARDSGVSIVAKRSGIVDQVDATRIVVRVTEETKAAESGVDIYNLLKFQRSNQNTCINQRPLVRVGDEVSRDDIIADGPSTELGELALGRNVLVAFMPWNGYNFEDSILISERIVHDDVFTSIHIEEFQVMARDTKLGQEEITRDIPNVSDEALQNLDEAGIVYVGAEVGPSDILVGKVTPKGESPITPEEKLLRAIFGEKAADVRDTSLRLPPGNKGTVVGVHVFSRRGIDKDERALAIEKDQIDSLAKDRDDERKILGRSFRGRFLEMIEGQQIIEAPEQQLINTKANVADLDDIPTAQLRKIVVEDDKINTALEGLRQQFDSSIGAIQARFDEKVENVQAGDELAPGVMKMIKIFVAIKRKLQPGDKMAGRHGNKGVISRIIPVQDMPYLDDGTHVDVVLNPLGVPSRMNVGQILETHLGWACAELGRQVGDAVDEFRKNHDMGALRSCMDVVYDDKRISAEMSNLSDGEIVELGENLRNGIPIATPVFDGAREEDINDMLRRAGLHESGQVWLTDGRTGERFDRPVTVGFIYMLKLHHLVDDKIHARSVGPYSLVTQQPLGGKAQFGGQRFGEMEVWALEAYGAAYTLQEMLTVKSDDVSGRTKVYESIVRGDDNFESGIPESFNVLVKELRSLGLNVEMMQND